MTETVAGGSFTTASGVLVNANGIALEAESDDLTTIRGIEKKRATELNSIGISTFQELIDADADGLVFDMDVSKRTVANWQKAAQKCL